MIRRSRAVTEYQGDNLRVWECLVPHLPFFPARAPRPHLPPRHLTPPRSHSSPPTLHFMSQTPLLVAAAAAAPEIVRDLLVLGANPDAADHGGRTALHLAAAYGHPEVLQVRRQHPGGLWGPQNPPKGDLKMGPEGTQFSLETRVLA